MKVICTQYRDGVLSKEPPVEIPLVKDNPNETPIETLERKIAGAERRGWTIERTSETEFHAWKEYDDGDGTPERPNRKDRYFKVVD